MKQNTNGYVQPAHRAEALRAARNLKMARSTQAYVRGSTVKFYEWLSETHDRLPEGPAVWICGDCHTGNIGPIANAEGEIAMAIRDLDQTVIGNPTHDLVRLGLSLAMSARDSNLPGVTTTRMLEELMLGYEMALRLSERAAAGLEHPSAFKIVLKQAVGRTWKQLAEERIGGVSPEIPLGKRFWPLLKNEKQAITDLFLHEHCTELKRALHPDKADLPIKVIDAAYWMKGCSSLGLLRYAALVKFEQEKSNENNMYLIDIKEATRTYAPHYTDQKMPREYAARVVEGACQLAPHLGERMVASRMMGRSVFLRELLPQDLKLEIGQMSDDDAVIAARYLGRIIGRAHARQMDSATRLGWRKELVRNHTKTLKAPSWLWSSVVDLIGTHERAYLEHCRRLAFGR